MNSIDPEMVKVELELIIQNFVCKNNPASSENTAFLDIKMGASAL